MEVQLISVDNMNKFLNGKNIIKIKKMPGDKCAFFVWWNGLIIAPQ